jgi:hypothetical protein
MQCLKCQNEALPGKALCAACFEVDTIRTQAEATEEWQRGVVQETRERVSKRSLDAAYRAERAGKRARQLMFLFLIVFGVALFIYWVLNQPDSSGNPWNIFKRKQPQGVEADSQQQKRAGAGSRGSGSNSNIAPNLRITSPTDGSLFSSTAPIPFTAVATDPDGTITSVRFMLGKQTLCSVYHAPYTCAWTEVTPGTFTIHAEAFDNLGATTKSRPITIDVFMPLTGEGTFTFTRPSAGSTYLLDAGGSITNVPVAATFESKMDATKISATITNGTCVSEGRKDIIGSCSLSEPGALSIRLTATLTNGAEVTGALPITAVRAPVTDLGQLNPYYSTEELARSTVDWAAPRANAPLDPNIRILPENERLFVSLNPSKDSSDYVPFGAMTAANDGKAAGSYDDVISLQNSDITQPFNPDWQTKTQPTVLKSQAFILSGTSGSPVRPDEGTLSKYGSPTLSNRGITFNSSYRAAGGHSVLMSKLDKGSAIERDNYFQNTLESVPSGRSYADTSPLEAADSYDGLFTHMLATIGDAGSDLAAITKLTIAGSNLPPETKRLLKATGNYAAILQWLWRAALPYADESGKPVPFDHEMRHRPAYVSNGEQKSEEWYPQNTAYHQYNESLHMREMLRLGSSFTATAPPVTVMSLVDYSVTGPLGQKLQSGSWDVGQEHIKLMLPTAARVWGKPGEKVSLRINLAASYDLFGQGLTYQAAPLYPEQSSLVEITQESPTQFVISGAYSDRFPRGRIPIIVTARNQSFTGTPAFVTFFWPNESVTESSLRNFYNPQDPSTHVNRNQKPVASSPTSERITALVGETVTIPLSCSDPEGFKTSWSRWAGEPGTIAGNQYQLEVGKELEGRTIPLHFICSDGTGGYNSLERTVVVSR